MNEDKIIQAVLENREEIEWIKENMATKSDMREISTNIDTLVKFAKKKDEEVTMFGHGLGRHEDRIQTLENDMKRVKPVVGLA